MKKKEKKNVPSAPTKEERLLKTKDGSYWDALFEDINKDPVPCCPHGGGFIYNIPRSEFVDFNAKLPETHRFVTIGFENEAICQAYVNFRERWNGWLCPCLDRHNLEVLVNDERMNCEAASMRLSIEGNELVVTHSDEPGSEPERVKPKKIRYGGKRVEVWDLGGMGWTWEHVGHKYVPGEVTAQEIAKDFCEELRNELGAEALGKVVALNRAETDPHICHSHDFCDANMPMVEAFLRHDIDACTRDKAVNQLWNEAWSLAKAAEFDPARIK